MLVALGTLGGAGLAIVALGVLDSQAKKRNRLRPTSGPYYSPEIYRQLKDGGANPLTFFPPSDSD
jgi:hypothetical protein